MTYTENTEGWGDTSPKRGVRAYRALRTFPRRVPLRAWLLIIVLVCTMGALLFSASAVTALMRGYVYQGVDSELKNAAGVTTNSGNSGWATNNRLFSNSPQTPRPPSLYYVEQILPDGSSIRFNDAQSSPDLSIVYATGDAYTVPAAAGSDSDASWRYVAVQASQGQGVIVVARSLAAEERLLGNLMAFQVAIDVIVLGILLCLAFLALNRALRPLRVIEKTAKDIAQGDIGRRVPSWPETTEIGSVAAALNSMLTQLQDSLNTARENEISMRRFLSDASHELRTPLTSVRGYAELYQSGALPDADRVIGKISEEAARMSTLVEDLLTLARGASGTQTFTKRSCDLVDIAHSAVETVESAHPGVHIEVTGSPHAPCFVDGDAVRRLIINLCTNALVHGEEPVGVDVEKRSEGVQITVSDEGPGMSAQDAAHVFDRFYRTDISRTRATGGTGLGLAICQSIVHGHGGSLWVDTAPGEGARFIVCFPGKHTDESDGESSTSEEA